MKNILFTLALLISFISFGQSEYRLGNYIEITKNNIQFRCKTPLAPFQKTENSFSSQGNINLVTSFITSTKNNVVVLQMYATPIPDKFNIDWEMMTSSEKQSKVFLNAFLGASANTLMKISKHEVKTINEKTFLEVKSTITASGVTQKQINWITVYNNNFINILGSTLSDFFDENLFLFKNFSNSILIK